MIGNKYAVKAAVIELAEHTEHVDVALVDEHLVIAGDLALDIAEVYVADTLLFQIGIQIIINRFVRFHLLKAAETKLQLICFVRVHVDELLIKLRAVNEPRRLPKLGHGGIVRVQRKLHTVFLRDGQYSQGNT